MRKGLILTLLLALSLPAAAQLPLWGGQLTGGLESDMALYRGGSFAANNYLKLDYVHGRFSAGLQMEYYPTPLLGYASELKGFGVPGKYIAWTAETWSLTLGDFYDQFGSGLLLRSWEDRSLGWNNSIGGARATLRTADDRFTARVLYGFPRKYLWYDSSQIAGADLTFRLNDIFAFEGCFTDRISATGHSLGGSLAASCDAGGFSGKAEYVMMGAGNAQLLSLNYAARSVSASVTLRRLVRMDDPLQLNYLPALCQEQTYMLASLNPYTTFGAGEIGGVADFYWRIKKSWKIHLNGSMIYALPLALKNYDHCRMAYRDFNGEVERRWNSRLKTILFVSIQEHSPSHGDRKATNAQNAFVLDALYRFTDNFSLRAQAQYLYSQELTKDWMAGLLEAGLAPHWSVHVSDMYNHGDTHEHYWEAGVSYSRSSFKLALSYGHQRAGYLCSGGVCRWQPEYTGGMLRLNYNF